MPTADPDVVTTRPSLHACYPRILLMLGQGATARAIGGVTVIYTRPLPVIRAVCVNQLYFSFGLDDRYLILIVTKCYRDI